MTLLSFHLLVAAGRAGWAAALLALPGHAQEPNWPAVL